MTTRETFDRMRANGFAYSGYSFKDPALGWITKWIKNEMIPTAGDPARTTLAWTNEFGAVVAQEVFGARVDADGHYWRAAMPARPAPQSTV